MKSEAIEPINESNLLDVCEMLHDKFPHHKFALFMVNDEVSKINYATNQIEFMLPILREFLAAEENRLIGASETLQ